MAVGSNYGHQLVTMTHRSFEMIHESIGFIDEDSDAEEAGMDEEGRDRNPNETVEETFGDEIKEEEVDSTCSTEPPKTDRSFSIAYW